MEIKLLNEGDLSRDVLASISAIHKNEISAGFLSTFSDAFLCSLYKAIICSPYTFLLAAFDDQKKVVGFICASTQPKRFRSYFLRRYFFRLIPSIFRKVFSLSTVRKLFETFFYHSKSEINLPEEEIINFCVDSRLQGRGLGKSLFYACTEEFKARGVADIKIVTGESQIVAQKFYEKLGAQFAGELQVHKGSNSKSYCYQIS